MPDSENDANDCEALIRWLWNEHKVELLISIAEFHSVSWEGGDAWPAPEYFGDNWKRGVVELALKVLDTDEKGQSDE
ncbi:MAG TPA: hypothetical protein ENI23_16510 [bacterium]|nr:hypothetical protein [bacterium]